MSIRNPDSIWRSLYRFCAAGAVVMIVVPANLSNSPKFTVTDRELLAGPNPQGDNRSIEQNQMSHGLPPPGPGKSAGRTPAVNPAVRKAKREEAMRDAATLADLAASLKKDLDQSNDQVVPVIYFDKAEQIEKLAKKLKNWAKSG
jgi:hypothetical protein